MTFEEMYKDYAKDIYNMEFISTDKYFFSYEISGEELRIIDVYVAPQYRGSKVTLKMYDHIDEFSKATGCKYRLSTVKRKDPHFEAALRWNIKRGQKPYKEDAQGRIFLRGEL